MLSTSTNQFIHPTLVSAARGGAGMRRVQSTCLACLVLPFSGEGE